MWNQVCLACGVKLWSPSKPTRAEMRKPEVKAEWYEDRKRLFRIEREALMHKAVDLWNKV